MRVVQINTFSYKATGSIMMNIHRLLNEDGHDSYVVWGRGRRSENDHEITISDEFEVRLHGVYTRLTDKTGFASKRATKELIQQLKVIRPDIVHLHNIHGYYINLPILCSYLKENRIKVVWTLHDCWAFTGHCAFFDMCGCEKWKTGCHHCAQKNTYPASMLLDNSAWNWEKKKELFTGLDATLVTPCKWLKHLVQESYLGSYPTHVIFNGIDRDVFKPTADDNVKIKYGLDNRPIILGVASEWTERKGLRDIVSIASEMPEYQFAVVGLTEKQKKALPKSVIGIKRTDNIQELVALYSIASIFFNPTYEDNFPTTNIEALACGTPVLTYDTGGSQEAVISSSIGRVIKKATVASVNMDTVKNTINEMMEDFYPTPAVGMNGPAMLGKNGVPGGRGDTRSLCRIASEQFDKNQRLHEYISLYESIIDNVSDKKR